MVKKQTADMNPPVITATGGTSEVGTPNEQNKKGKVLTFQPASVFHAWIKASDKSSLNGNL